MVIDPRKQSHFWRVWLALWIVYIVWGSTYLAIRITVRDLPPLVTAGARFLIAGLALYAWLAFRHKRLPTVSPRQLVGATLIGTALLFGGNGMVMVAEQEVSSSLAALIIASVSLWVVALRAITGERVSGLTIAGVIVGFIGVGILVMPGGESESNTAGVLLLVAASVSWACGSFFSKKLTLPSDPFVSTAVQMLAGGAVMAVAGLIGGEAGRLDLLDVSVASWAAFIYLIAIGSLLAFTAYVWLLQNAPISKVATYSYVNPVIAIILGWAILSEEITMSMLIGAALIIGSVAVVVRRESEEPKQAEPHVEGAAAPMGSASVQPDNA